jgi:hypothetical protein
MDATDLADQDMLNGAGIAILATLVLYTLRVDAKEACSDGGSPGASPLYAVISSPRHSKACADPRRAATPLSTRPDEWANLTPPGSGLSTTN